MVPNHPRSQLRHTRISIQFFGFCVEVGQTVVKLKIHAFLSLLKVPKVRTVKGFSGLSYFLGYNCPTRSQSKRATKLRHASMLLFCCIGIIYQSLFFVNLCLTFDLSPPFTFSPKTIDLPPKKTYTIKKIVD